MKNLRIEFQEYRQACYGDQEISDGPLREIEQAFLSGIHLALNRPLLKPNMISIQKQIKARLLELGAITK